MDDDITLAGYLIEVAHGISQRMDRWLMREHGLPLVAFEVLLRLYRSPGSRLRLSVLANQVTLTRSGLTRAIDRMERDLLVTREACDADRRGIWAVLTPTGRDRVAPIVAAHHDFLNRELLSPLDDAQRHALLALLEPVRNHVNPGAAPQGVPGAARQG